METHLILFAIAVISRSINFGNILQIILIRISYPKATLKDVEKFLQSTKTKLNFPKLWK